MHKIVGVKKHHIEPVPAARRFQPGTDESAFANFVGKPLCQVSLGCERHLQHNDLVPSFTAKLRPVMTGDHDQRLGISAAPDRPDCVAQILFDRVPVVADEPGL